MHIVLVYRYYNDGIVYYNLTFCTRKSLMNDLGLSANDEGSLPLHTKGLLLAERKRCLASITFTKHPFRQS